MPVPEPRLSYPNRAPVRPDGAYVLYWMIASRRLGWNYGLQRAVEHARIYDLPLLVFEPLRVGYRWASDRHHAFALQGMAEHAAAAQADGRFGYYPYVEPTPGAGAGLLAALAARAAVVVTDQYPCSFLPNMVAAAGRRLDVLLEAVDSNGLLPLRSHQAPFATAMAFRRHLHRNLEHHLGELPLADALQGLPARPIAPPAEILARWPAADAAMLAASREALGTLPIDHTVRPVATRGGAGPAGAALARFLDERLDRYADERSEVDAEVASGLSPWLHWGHLSVHEVWRAVVAREGWTPDRLGKPTGQRAGWWGLSAAAESFLDELVTWRELGYGFCHHRPDYAAYDGLPDWARATLAEHSADPRPRVYTLAQLDAAATHDPLWNAAQRQLRAEGHIHNYLRMLWGKKVLEWSPTPQQGFEALIELNNRYAIDGRDPNSYSGIAWTFGRFDRPWGPVRPIFGTIRYMSSDNTARKYRVDRYLARWSG